MFETLTLYCVQQYKGERSLSAILHMLTGKKSSQTFQDVHAYGLTPFFGIHRSLVRKDLEVTARNLKQKGYLKYYENGNPFLTDKGKSTLQNDWCNYPFSSLNGMHYHYMDQTYWSRLLLFVQTASNIGMGKHQFIPVHDQKEIINWVKRKYQKEHQFLQQHLQGIYEELSHILTQIPNHLAEMIVYRMTGYHRYGFSKEQLALKYEVSIHDISIYLTMAIHFQLSSIITYPSTYPLLFSYCKDCIDDVPLTQSAKKSKEWLDKGFSIEYICRIRNLKESTIQDHIVEIALVDPTFSLYNFVSLETAQDISRVAKMLNTNRLKAIKQTLQDKYSYFQIRVVLATIQKEGLHESANI
ncbi:hypothetical protein GLW05_03760 [Pontibacillus yanchengensis]|uniref:Helicase Helix-turn-helix domain-containing protein n=1 Tax=Pontibacillus yanchengensis TaxID=462910 RepID=A0A6I4ZWJ6_9BACI|nr:helix-turn-helix domain-containing protein [Pontibacillus yanchengensis]MYL32707.1 hypothetical protein [Pontibacillus yanchengensis]